MFSIEALIVLVIWIIVLGLIFGLLWWAVDAVGIPEPFRKVARAVIVIAAVLIACVLLLNLLPHPMPLIRP